MTSSSQGGLSTQSPPPRLSEAKAIKTRRTTALSSGYLEGDFRRHGEAVSDDRLFFCGATLPAVQFDAAAPGQEDLLVHLDRGVPRELPGCRREHTHTHTHTLSKCSIDL